MTFARNIDLKGLTLRLVKPARCYLIPAVAGVSFLFQLADAGMEVKDLFTTTHANALDFVGVGEILLGFVSAVLLRR
jgi:hypothetical protein